MQTQIKNPILHGFNPDPSILRVGNDYYLATSTFEWFPGVQIYHSSDMVNWELKIRPVGERHIDMKGNPPSGGIWAPCLSHDGELFHLIYTDVKNWINYLPFKDQLNYLITASNIEGPWSDPVYLNGSGFDGSLFHNDDGKKYFLNMEWDHRKEGSERFSGILIQEYDSHKKELTGPIRKISRGSDLGRSEGPHIYKKNNYYYLMLAEGGTSYEHAVTILRSKELFGPYELPEKYPLCTAWKTDAYLKKAGHGSFVDDGKGNWYLAHLCGRPLPGTSFCNLGRETAIQEIIWENDWPCLKRGGNTPYPEYNVPGDIKINTQSFWDYDLSGPNLSPDFQTLRTPFSADVYRFENGSLLMRGRESIVSTHNQSLVARRQSHFCFRAETELMFNPENFQKMAGLIYRYDELHQYYLYCSLNEETAASTLNLLKINYKESELATIELKNKITKFNLRIEAAYAEGQFSYSIDEGVNWNNIGGKIDISIMSDEYVEPMGFTGAFVGMACQDLQNQTAEARFLSFTYTVIED